MGLFKFVFSNIFSGARFRVAIDLKIQNMGVTRSNVEHIIEKFLVGESR